MRKHLQILIETGWVREHDVIPPVYTLNRDDAKAQWLLDFLQKMGCL